MYIRLLRILCMRNNTRAWESSVPLFSNRKTCSYLSTTSSGAKRGDLVKPWQTEIVSMKLSEAFNVHWTSNWEHNLQVLLEEHGKRFPCLLFFVFVRNLPHSQVCLSLLLCTKTSSERGFKSLLFLGGGGGWGGSRSSSLWNRRSVWGWRFQPLCQYILLLQWYSPG